MYVAVCFSSVLGTDSEHVRSASFLERRIAWIWVCRSKIMKTVKAKEMKSVKAKPVKPAKDKKAET